MLSEYVTTCPRPSSSDEAADLRSLEHQELVAAFRANTAAYFGQRGSDTNFAMELFRRAIAERDQLAWQALHAAYLPLVVGWVTHHPAFPHRRGDESGYLANRAFERFWWAMRPHRLANFPNLPSLLKYLKMCASCAVVDAARADAHIEYQPLDECDVASEGRGNVDQTQALVQAEQLWQKVVTVIRDPDQEQLAWDTLVLGMTPRQVLATRPDTWHSIREVYEAKAALLRRLRTSSELAALRPG